MSGKRCFSSVNFCLYYVSLLCMKTAITSTHSWRTERLLDLLKNYKLAGLVLRTFYKKSRYFIRNWAIPWYPVLMILPYVTMRNENIAFYAKIIYHMSLTKIERFCYKNMTLSYYSQMVRTGDHLWWPTTWSKKKGPNSPASPYKSVPMSCAIVLLYLMDVKQYFIPYAKQCIPDSCSKIHRPVQKNEQLEALNQFCSVLLDGRENVTVNVLNYNLCRTRKSAWQIATRICESASASTKATRSGRVWLPNAAGSKNNTGARSKATTCRNSFWSLF